MLHNMSINLNTFFKIIIFQCIPINYLFVVRNTRVKNTPVADLFFLLCKRLCRVHHIFPTVTWE